MIFSSERGILEMMRIIRPRYIFLVMTVSILFYGGMAQAVNNRPPSFFGDKEKRETLVEVEKKKAQARENESKKLMKDLTPLEKKWGIKFYGIRWTSAGYMLEMKFRVLDPEKAFPLLKRDIKRYVVVDKSGAVLEVPFTQKLGSLKSSVRTSNMVKKDTNYIALFANPSKHVNPGDKVTLVIGNFMAENLIVQ